MTSDGKRDLIVVGLMSGTSLDGISSAVVRFTDTHERLSASLLAFVQRPYAPDERAQLERAMHAGTAQEYCRLNVELGRWLADAAVQAINEAGVARGDIAAIASHGQTLWHEPGHSTWQLGCAATIAERSGCPVVSNFRARDVAAGGQGAPLVPMADAMLFAHDTRWRALQNLGGIGNVTVVPPMSTTATRMTAVRAFDTGPGVVLIDAVTRRLYPGMAFDVDGRIARTGHAVHDVVTDRLSLPFFGDEPPKSTGRELFNAAFIDAFVADCDAHGATPADIVATAVEFTARSIADQYRRFIPEPVADVLLSGGGARNTALVDAIGRALDADDVRARRGAAPMVGRFDAEFFDGEAKEAVAFALLGYLHLTGRTGNVPSATGARGARRLGELTPA